VWLFLALTVLLALAACNQPAIVTTGQAIQVSDAWGRTSPMMAEAAAFYMLVRNTGSQADAMVGGQSPACQAVEMHESYMTDNGAMGMRPVEGGIQLPAGGQAELKPGGLHVMCIGLASELKVGDKVPVTLQFTNADDLTVEVEIRQP